MPVTYYKNHYSSKGLGRNILDKKPAAAPDSVRAFGISPHSMPLAEDLEKDNKLSAQLMEKVKKLEVKDRQKKLKENKPITFNLK